MSHQRLGAQSLRIGSSEECEIRLRSPGALPVHAEIVHQGHGRLTFVALGPGFFAGSKSIAKGEAVPYDFHAEFSFEGEVVPLTAPEICAMLMTRGQLPLDPNQLVIGRDPERVHLVLASPGVSGRHATFLPSSSSLIDHGSTSGTWVHGQKLPASESVSVGEDTVAALGPVPLPIRLARSIHESWQRAPEPRRAAKTMTMPEMAAVDLDRVVPRETQTKHRTLVGTVRMMATGQKIIGRSKDADIVLEHPQISAKHARLLTIGGQLLLEDSGSELGTYVRGTRLKAQQHVPVSDGERVHFGPVPALLHVAPDGTVAILLEDEASWLGRPLFELVAKGLTVEVADRDGTGVKRLLDEVSFRANPGDFIALMGPSGAGKTTLLHLLNGYRSPTSGSVLVNGQPLATVIESLRGSIGYVPQDDILHPELTVYEAVLYSARLRLPSDYSASELDARVNQTLADLGLEAVRDLTIGRPEAKVLSGGQRKRVNIAIEIVTDPPLLFLDEPTSGLAADDTTALVDLLARLAKNQGKTIIATIHQPARDEYEKFSHALVLGHGGVPLFFGATRGAYRFFEAWRPLNQRAGIDNPRDMFAELSEREARIRAESKELTRAAARRRASLAFREEFGNTVEGRALALETSGDDRSTLIALPPLGKRRAGQLALLIGRYAKVKSRDRIGTAILLLQAPIIGILLALVFGGQKPAVPYFCLSALEELSRHASDSSAVQRVLGTLQSTRDQSAAIFFLVVSAIWFGTSNAAREIVAERAIYRRERMVGLSLPAYMLSKFLVLGALCLGQCTVLYSIVFAALGLAGGALGFISGLSLLFLTSISAVGLGLTLSAVVASTEAAMALTPIALIPQVVLGGLMVPVTTVPWLAWPMKFIPARWGFEGVVRVQRLAEATTPAFKIPVPGINESLPEYVLGGYFRCAEAQLKSGRFLGGWGFTSAQTPWMPVLVLVSMTLALLGVAMLSVRRREKH